MSIKPDAKSIKRWREERHWSQEHVAEMAGIGLRTLQRIENGDTASRESVMALAAAFNVDIGALVDDPIKQQALEAKEKATKGLAALMLSFMIHLASYLLGMVVFAAISLSDGSPGYAMLAPTLWWTVGLAGHGLAVAIVEIVTRFENAAE